MFHWCQKVNVYNIENHYHFYSEKEESDKETPSLTYQKLKTGSISVTTANTKRNSKSCFKKGLNISKKISVSNNPEPQSVIFTNKNESYRDFQNRSIFEHCRSATIGSTEVPNYRTLQNDSNSRQILTASHQSVKEDPEQKQIQRILVKRKPSIQIEKEGKHKQQNNILISRLYLTSCLKQKTENRQNTNKQIFVGHKDDIHQLATSRNLCSKMQSNDSINERRSQTISNLGNNSKYNISHLQSMSGSVVSQYTQSQHNDCFYLRIMEASRGQARQASIILSNILSRSIEPGYASSHKRKNSINSIKNKKKLNFEDKQTILSHSNNDVLSDCSLKIEQSELCQLDPKNNFTILQYKSIKTCSYSLHLAIENYNQCIVSLKQIGFRQMSAISQQLQMYEFIQQILLNRDSYHNILELYQMQTTNGSYILIKQAYTHTVSQYLSSLSQQKRNQFSRQFHSVVKMVLGQFAHHLMFPSRMLAIDDFVVCQSVIKIHDLSLFKQMKSSSYSIEEIWQSLSFYLGLSQSEIN